ncbi:hypothetical protein PFLA_b0527 [Pseudoalteromonas flavipulchra NCIMB 2033 = ATCC BAA-314]|nr:hypothetical protein [Pseudoalteromonas flavipulchra NCIMB 2033 = ATCC BAA-314]
MSFLLYQLTFCAKVKAYIVNARRGKGTSVLFYFINSCSALKLKHTL